MKILDFIQAESLHTLILELNKLRVQKEDLVNIIQKDSSYVAIFYYTKDE